MQSGKELIVSIFLACFSGSGPNISLGEGLPPIISALAQPRLHQTHNVTAKAPQDSPVKNVNANSNSSIKAVKLRLSLTGVKIYSQLDRYILRVMLVTPKFVRLKLLDRLQLRLKIYKLYDSNDSTIPQRRRRPLFTLRLVCLSSHASLVTSCKALHGQLVVQTVRPWPLVGDAATCTGCHSQPPLSLSRCKENEFNLSNSSLRRRVVLLLEAPQKLRLVGVEAGQCLEHAWPLGLRHSRRCRSRRCCLCLGCSFGLGSHTLHLRFWRVSPLSGHIRVFRRR